MTWGIVSTFDLSSRVSDDFPACLLPYVDSDCSESLDPLVMCIPKSCVVEYFVGYRLNACSPSESL